MRPGRLRPGRVYLELVIHALGELLRSCERQVPEAIGQVLARVGELTGVDRACVFRFTSAETMDNTHEWLAPGTPSMIDQSQNLPVSLLDPWAETLAAGKPFVIPDVRKLPAGSPERRILEQQGVRSLLAAPMMTRGQLIGVLNLDATRGRRRFSAIEVQLMQAIANAISVLLDRSTAEAEAAKARRELEAKRAKLQATLNALPYLVLEIDGEGRYVSHNALAESQEFLSPKVFMGNTVFDVLPPEIIVQYNHAIARIEAGAAKVSVDYAIELNGQTRWHNVILVPRLVDGQRDGVYTIVRDFTEQQQQQYEIARLGEIARLTSNLVILADAESRVEWVNPAFEKKTGWTLAEVRGKRPADLWRSPNADKEATRKIDEAIANAQPLRSETLNVTRDGQEFWVVLDNLPLRDAHGKVRGFLSVQTDITPIKQSHSREVQDWQLAIQGTSDGIAMLDQTGRYAFMNNAYREIFGIPEAVLPEALCWQDLHPEAPAPWLPAPGHGRAQRLPVRHLPLVGQRLDGAAVPQEVTLTPREDGKVLVITRDITQRRQMEADRAALRDAVQVAQQRATIAHVSAFVAHDLNNAIAVVSGASARLEARLEADIDALASIRQIQRATAMASQLVVDLKQLGQTGGSPQQLDLRHLVERGVDLIGQARIERHKVKIQLPEHEQPVWAEATRVLQVLTNLLLNACDSRQDRPARVLIEVLSDPASAPTRRPDVGLWRPDVRYSVFRVTDDGPGLSPEVRSRIFEPYFTTKGSQGTGIGLPIVATILQDNAGAIWLDNRPEGGLAVTVAWPVMAVAGAWIASPAPPSSDPVPQGPKQLEGCTIMVVDDVADVADIIAAQLERAGADAVGVTDPQDACDLLTEQPAAWSALLTDFNMKGMTGADLAAVAAGLDPPVPTLIVTGEPEKVRFATTQTLGILCKPVQEADLVASVAKLIRAGNRTSG